MTTHDEDAAIGGLTKRYSEAKRKKAALVGEIEKSRQELIRIERTLQHVSSHGTMTSETVPKLPPTYPDPTKLAELLTDLRATMHELEHTHKLLKDAGVEVS